MRVLSQTNGTSYAVAHTAGVAALWLAKHGHPALVSRYGAGRIQATFLELLRRPGVCRRTPDWNSGEYGAGVIDAEALLREPLPEPFAVAGPRSRAAGAPDDTIGRLAAQTASTRQAVAGAIDALFGAGSSDDEAFLRRFEGELVYLAMADPTFRAARRHPGPAAPGRRPRGSTPRPDCRRRRWPPPHPSSATGSADAGSSSTLAAPSIRRTSRARRAATTRSATTSVRDWVAPATLKNRRRTLPTTTTSVPASRSRPAAGGSNQATGTERCRRRRGCVTSNCSTTLPDDSSRVVDSPTIVPRRTTKLCSLT